MRTARRSAQEPLGDRLARPPDWPPVLRLPHNERKEVQEPCTVGGVLQQDLHGAGDAILVGPLVDLSALVDLLDDPTGLGGPRRLLLGRAPGHTTSDGFRARRRSAWACLREAVTGLRPSLLQSMGLLRLQDRLRDKRITVRVAEDPDRAMSACILVTEQAAVIGSSAVSPGGLTHDLAANLRVPAPAKDQEGGSEPSPHSDIRTFVEAIWARAEERTQDFEALLGELMRLCTWEEAVARASTLILDGTWTQHRFKLPAGQTLWPHQRAAIARGLYLLDHAGGLLVADATGSGKTRLGAWLVAAAWSRRRRKDGDETRQAVLVVPPGVLESWQKSLKPTFCAHNVHSRGDLSSPRSTRHRDVLSEIDGSMLLAIDEAHNFVNRSNRTMGVLRHLADEAILFTATPISRGGSDLLAMLALLGADNLDDAQVQIISDYLGRGRRREVTPDDLSLVKDALKTFMVRRTRAQISRYVHQDPEAYRSQDGQPCRYPHHHPRAYLLPLSDPDAATLQDILQVVDDLSGLNWLGDQLRPSVLIDDPERALKALLASARGLARYQVLSALRSSTAALHEHVWGTERAASHHRLPHSELPKKASPGVLTRLEGLKLPVWRFKDPPWDGVPAWLNHPEAFHAAREEERERYGRIAELAGRLSADRVHQKVKLLADLGAQHRAVLAFDRHLISLKLLERGLKEREVPTQLFTGRGGTARKRRAEKLLGRAGSERGVALCTDAFSEGLNLQGASCVVHLDTPTVIRTAVQRAGRVDRLDSPNQEVEIWWPQEPPLLAPSKGEKLLSRVQEERRLIGSDVLLPEQSDPIQTAELQSEAQEALEVPDDLRDAFSAVEDLISGDPPFVPLEVVRQVREEGGQRQCLLSLLPTDHRSWAFFALDGDRGAAPRWVLFRGPEAEPITDLETICAWFRENLGPELHPTQDAQVTTQLEAYTRRLCAAARALLSRRRQRALLQLEQVLTAHLERRTGFEREEREAIRGLLSTLTPTPGDPLLDLRALADRWLAWLRPRWEELIREGSRRHLPRLKDLEPGLEAQPPSLDEIQELFDGLSTTIPLDRQVVVAIVAVNSTTPQR